MNEQQLQQILTIQQAIAAAATAAVINSLLNPQQQAAAALANQANNLNPDATNDLQQQLQQLQQLQQHHQHHQTERQLSSSPANITSPPVSNNVEANNRIQDLLLQLQQQASGGNANTSPLGLNLNLAAVAAAASAAGGAQNPLGTSPISRSPIGRGPNQQELNNATASNILQAQANLQQPQSISPSIKKLKRHHHSGPPASQPFHQNRSSEATSKPVSNHHQSSKSGSNHHHSNQPNVSRNSTSSGSTSSTSSAFLANNVTLPRKLVRGQDVWLGRGAEQTRQILKCMWCGQSFRTLDVLSEHMRITKHYTNIISQEQITSWRQPTDNNTSSSTTITPTTQSNKQANVASSQSRGGGGNFNTTNSSSSTTANQNNLNHSNDNRESSSEKFSDKDDEEDFEDDSLMGGLDSADCDDEFEPTDRSKSFTSQRGATKRKSTSHVIKRDPHDSTAANIDSVLSQLPKLRKESTGGAVSPAQENQGLKPTTRSRRRSEVVGLEDSKDDELVADDLSSVKTDNAGSPSWVNDTDVGSRPDFMDRVAPKTELDESEKSFKANGPENQACSLSESGDIEGGDQTAENKYRSDEEEEEEEEEEQQEEEDKQGRESRDQQAEETLKDRPERPDSVASGDDEPIKSDPQSVSNGFGEQQKTDGQQVNEEREKHDMLSEENDSNRLEKRQEGGGKSSSRHKKSTPISPTIGAKSAPMTNDSHNHNNNNTPSPIVTTSAPTTGSVLVGGSSVARSEKAEDPLAALETMVEKSFDSRVRPGSGGILQRLGIDEEVCPPWQHINYANWYAAAAYGHPMAAALIAAGINLQNGMKLSKNLAPKKGSGSED